MPELPPQPQTPQPRNPSSVDNLPQVASTTRSVAPNMIGDFLNSGTTGIRFSTRVGAVPFANSATNFNGPVLSGMPTAAQLVNGFDLTDSGGFGVGLTAREAIGTIVTNGDRTFIEPMDLNPLLTRVTFQTSASLAEVNAALANGGTLPALAPISNDDIYLRVQNALRSEYPDLADAVDLVDFFELRLVPEESTLNSDGVGGVTASYVYELVFNVPAPSPGELIGRVSFSDNASPLPRDRFFIDFNYFHQAQIGPADLPLNRLVLGAEKTFLDGITSLEIRVPMAITANSTINTSGTDALDYELGDVAFGAKVLLWDAPGQFYTAGLGVTIPTADDFRVNLSNNVPLLHIRNDSVHVVPYVAALLTPTDDVFLQSFLAVDVDTNGNAVSLNEDALNNAEFASGTLGRIGRLQASTLLKLDAQAGYWHFRDRPRSRRRFGVSAAATVLEAHLATVVSDPDRITRTRVNIGQPDPTTVLNLTIGEQLYFGPNDNVTIGYGVPVTDDRYFEGEFRMFYNRFF